MKHKIGYNRLGRKTAHRKAMTRNMLTSFFRHERIKTTKAKALVVRRAAEKMITRSRVDSVHNRRMIARDIKDKAVLAKLFTDIAPRYLERPGGYTRILKLGPRHSDAAEMVILELVADEAVKKDTGKKKPSKKAASPVAAEAAPEKAEAPVAEEAHEEIQTDSPDAEAEAGEEKTEADSAE
ncbi:50S ribosomal protein L17 [Alkalispirochaeta sphaeroplastigenens]|uniref:Large ribosomal subunit protein bL17 n=1 Tax=Alkalispirochaeta sphaeroplastigenens TaxID=1187066 RepID=A0A2S4JH86_9SPIO|nr:MULTISPECIES: 50S ribosomal protein L17 [Alkalispirochaeta]POQ98780.1 50S ribosomal protein L17 [Alkalispirochaeta sphaeroplastigenens]